LEGLRRALEADLDSLRQLQLLPNLLDGVHRLPQGGARSEIEGHGGDRELPLVIDHQRRRPLMQAGETGQGYLTTGRRHMDTAQGVSSGSSRNCSITLGTHSPRVSLSRLVRVNWYWVRATRSSILSSCTGWNQAWMPSTSVARSRSRSITVNTDSLRSLCGGRLMNM